VLCFSSLCKCVYVFSVNTKVYSHPSLHHIWRPTQLDSTTHHYARPHKSTRHLDSHRTDSTTPLRFTAYKQLESHGNFCKNSTLFITQPLKNKVRLLVF
jgi:hypothetical protein